MMFGADCPPNLRAAILRLAGDTIPTPIGGGAASAGEEREDHADAPEQPASELAAAALKIRAKTMFAGTIGVPVASGEAAAAEKPTYGLIKLASSVVEKDLEPALFDRYAKHRPCGLLNQYEAVGMLIGDILGLPLVPPDKAERVGKVVQLLIKAFPAEVKKTRRKAAHKGDLRQQAAAESLVLCRAVDLPLPSAEECAAAAAARKRAKQPKPQPEPAPPAAPSSPSAEAEADAAKQEYDQAIQGGSISRRWSCSVPGYAPRPHPSYELDRPFLPGFRGAGGATGEEMWDPDAPPCIPSDERPEKLFGSEVVAKATAAASVLERNWPQEPDPRIPPEDRTIIEPWEEVEREENEEMARVQYKFALRRLAEAFPELELPAKLYEWLRASEVPTRPCPCGAGQLAQWPWMLQTASLGFCPGAVAETESGYKHICGRHIWEKMCWRNEWVEAWPGGKWLDY